MQASVTGIRIEAGPDWAELTFVATQASSPGSPEVFEIGDDDEEDSNRNTDKADEQKISVFALCPLLVLVSLDRCLPGHRALAFCLGRLQNLVLI